MKTNIGSLDKVVRLLAAVVLVILFYANVLKGIIGIVALVVALTLTVTCFIGICPFYSLLKIDTKSKKTPK